jgi:cytochrome c oxidase subunit I+III
MIARGRRTLDVSGLPEVVFGTKDPNWWGTLLFMVIEGTTLAVCATTYLYLRQNTSAWPPEHVPLPDVLLPTVNMLLLLGAMVPMWLASRAAHRLDAGATGRWLAVGALYSLLVTVLRFWEFAALNVRWDRNAYGSAAWATLGFHTTLLVVDVLETAVMASFFLARIHKEKHFSDASDAAFYQYFLSLAYVPLYVLLFLLPRWI